MSENLFTLTIHLIHGDPMKFEVEMTEVKKLGLSDDIEQALNRNAMAIEAEGKLYMIPYSNVQYIESDPSPDDLPIYIIRDAKRLVN
jgi:protoporphyrinogen oxidase